jgi:hypothetical protein
MSIQNKIVGAIGTVSAATVLYKKLKVDKEVNPLDAQKKSDVKREVTRVKKEAVKRTRQDIKGKVKASGQSNNTKL